MVWPLSDRISMTTAPSMAGAVDDGLETQPLKRSPALEEPGVSKLISIQLN